jgi:hypothetical protein
LDAMVGRNAIFVVCPAPVGTVVIAAMVGRAIYAAAFGGSDNPAQIRARS